MDLRQLSYFTALFEEGSVTRAARRVNVVQPALSMQIAKLEQELGQKLFDRLPKSVAPTASGRALYQLVRPLLDNVAEVRATMARRTRAVSGRLTVGVLSSLTLSVIPGVLLRFAEQFPDVELSLADGFSAGFLDEVESGQLDVAVVNKPERRHGLTLDHLLDEDMVVLGSAATALPGSTAVHTRDLARFDLILPSARHGLRVELDRRLAAEGVILTPRLEVDLMSAIADIVARSSLFTILPLLASGRQLEAGTLKAYRIVSPRLTRQLVVAVRRDRPPSPAATGFLDMLSDALVAAAAALEVHVVGERPVEGRTPRLDARDQSSLFDMAPKGG